MKAVYKMHIDCGRMGELEGVFVAGKKQVEKLLSSGVGVYFGEVLGKHSEVYSDIEQKNIKMISDDQNVVDVIEKHELQSGYNPFEYTSINFDYESIGLDDDCSVEEIIDKLIEKEAN
ncbi:hypothetical protein OZ664_11710 [Elizabethkingia sp. HX WHF]|uniref:hypothetical protein n=1 Tax=Elizabethkingia sp. HX WHF TaxID=3003190 RepID=UPI002A2402FD|nr:hypothetical protein [Elizabethkingia sp. HX WHF]MDX8564666.1 hypothetical protein [Elizabethkingia sp. HX WHF]